MKIRPLNVKPYLSPEAPLSPTPTPSKAQQPPLPRFPKLLHQDKEKMYCFLEVFLAS